MFKLRLEKPPFVKPAFRKPRLKKLNFNKRKALKYTLSALILIGATLSFKTALERIYDAEEVFLTANAEEKKLPIYSVDTEGKKVALTFNAAWGSDDVDEILTILEENDVKSTFFFCGYWVDRYPDEVRKIYTKGHDIANHSDTHPHPNLLSLEKNKEEIMNVHEKVKELLGYEMKFYRPPFGEYNNTVIQAAEESGYYPVQWDVDSLDWKKLGVEHEINQVLNNKNLKDGSIILFHNDAEHTPAALGPIIKGLKEQGYEIVPLSELIHEEDYHINNEGRQILNSKKEETGLFN
ncbi:polysaccharide deacetylase family protein [Anaeropeptidivorans aminofermentans]|uniref:polysaccharide deacetylase family protein n=1 Tax=Anaeropeptidivorans aminofermentans TaxID=2934315 RepID=UPI0020241738|nr:polysaccharide deacetylase family protein [Anaeropeptidivorans aminofermentans]